MRRIPLAEEFEFGGPTRGLIAQEAHGVCRPSVRNGAGEVPTCVFEKAAAKGRRRSTVDFSGHRMIDFAVARRMMVDGQVRTADVTDPRVVDAMLALPRERFMLEGKQGLAYLDLAAPVAESGPGRPGRCLLKPMVLGKLLQALEIKEGDSVLDVGCTTGYSAALMAQIAKSVIALEEDPVLAARAKQALAAAGTANATVVSGPLPAGWPNEGPYDVILVEGATEFRPQTLYGQLKEGGRLACISGRGPAGKAMLYRVSEGEVSGRPIFDAAAEVLPGFAAPDVFVF